VDSSSFENSRTLEAYSFGEFSESHSLKFTETYSSVIHGIVQSRELTKSYSSENSRYPIQLQENSRNGPVENVMTPWEKQAGRLASCSRGCQQA
jgi:hypothetical protein